jgi:hypothetical protein
MTIYAARKAPKRPLVDPAFYAKQEERLPMSKLTYMVDKGMTLQEMRQEHPDMSEDDVERANRIIDMREGNNTQYMVRKTGVDVLVRQMAVNPSLRDRVYSALKDPQKSSFLATNGSSAKVEILREKLK